MKKYIKLLYHPKQRLFHLADEGDPINRHLGWCYIARLPDNLAFDFIYYAEERILNSGKIITYKIMRDEFYKWLYKI